MTDKPDSVLLPKSVIAYLTDHATRAGVEALLAVESDTLPPEIEWTELGDYFAARAVAELTKAELAVALHRLWLTTWGPRIPQGWTLPSPEELDEAGQGVSTGVIWDEKVFYVYHRNSGSELYTLVGLDRNRITVAFTLEHRDKPQIMGGVDDFIWRDDASWPAWMLMTQGVVPGADGTMDLARLRAAADLAIAAVASAPQTAKPKPAARGAPRGKPGRGRGR